MVSRKRRIGRVLSRVGLAVAAAALVFLAAVLVAGWRAFGHRADGARRERMERSPQWHDGHFVNPEPLVNYPGKMLRGLFDTSDDVHPRAPVPVAAVDAKTFAVPPETGLRVTWFGHSSTLVEIDGVHVLTDPVWSERASPLSFVGPERWTPPLVALADLSIDAVVISHDHYDHLDMGTIDALKARDITFVVPLGVGAHLAYWGVPEKNIVELDWWEKTRVKSLDIVSVPARHASGRMLIDNDSTLWSGYALVGDKHRVYYSGDSGVFPAMKDIGAKLGPFDLAMVECGQYNAAWPDWHMGPERTAQTAQLVGARALLPVHWGLFVLAYHAWTEPVERVLAVAKKRNVAVSTPKLGESFEPDRGVVVERWWPTLPWQTAEEAPLVSTGVDGL